MVTINPLILLSLLSIPTFSNAQPFGSISTRNHHARLAERINAASPLLVDRQVEGGGRGGEKRIIKRSGKICKVRGSNSTAVPIANAGNGTTTSTTIATSTGTPSTNGTTASTVGGENIAISSSITASATASTTSVAAAAAAAVTSSATSSTSAAATSSSAATTISTSSLTPNGIKAGIAGGDSYQWMQDHIGWWYDWSPNPSQSGKPIAVSMLWGNGGLGSEENDASRLATFESLTTTPQYILGFEEPDCSTAGSAAISVSAGATTWNNVIGPWQAKGSLLGSPSMCKQADETWLTPFKADINVQWDFTAIHVNKNNMAGVKLDIDHYWNTYGKPIWVTEFACVDDSNWTPCTDQSEINTYINNIVDLFESDSRVYAYAYSDGEGLGSVWPTTSNGQLSQSGQTYLNAISKYH